MKILFVQQTGTSILCTLYAMFKSWLASHKKFLFPCEIKLSIRGTEISPSKFYFLHDALGGGEDDVIWK
jgi:hypothetical protein